MRPRLSLTRYACHVAYLAAVASCADDGERDVVGPFTGETHRYVIDIFNFPTNAAERRAYSDDLDGDGEADNQFGGLTQALLGQGNLNENASDMVGAGALASTIEIQADDLVEDGSVGVRYFGADGDEATVVGGTLSGGKFRSNRARSTSVPGTARLRLPLFVDVNPTEVELVGVQFDLVPDGRGGFDGFVAGAIVHQEAVDAAADGVSRMIMVNPRDHLVLANFFDRVPRDGVITPTEVAENSLMLSLLAPDLDMFDRDGKYDPKPLRYIEPDALSVGFFVHISPCPSGRCASLVFDACHDRLLDGDESDVDCGGSCALACPGGAACRAGYHCQSGSCDAGVCRAVSCSDGILNGFETGTDYGPGCE